MGNNSVFQFLLWFGIAVVAVWALNEILKL